VEERLLLTKENRLLRVGVLGAGLIAQAAHLEACRKARNIELYGLCDAATDLLEKVAAVFEPERRLPVTRDFLFGVAVG
jgi:predicted dehydrogenase